MANFLVNDNEVQVTEEQNKALTEKLTFAEFTEAIKSMHPDKASGPDGLDPAFFPTFLESVWQGDL